MAIFASTTLGTSDPSRAMSIKALETRAQALAAAQAKQELPTSLPSPWQGAGYLTNTVADALATRRADQQAATGRQDLANLMGQVGPEGPTPQQLAGITTRAPELGQMYAQQAFSARQNAADIAARKEAAAEAARTHEAAAVAAENRVQARPTDLPAVQLKRALERGEITQADYDAAARKLNAQPASEQKFVAEEQDRNIDLQGSVATLKEASELLNQGIYSGAGASVKGAIGPYTPSALEGFTGTDAETTKRTDRYNKIMSPEALAMLSKMKGAQSDKEMKWALDTMNDQNSSLDNKKRALQVLHAKVSAHLARSELTLKDLGGKRVEVDIPPAGGGAPAAPAAAPAAGGGDANAAARAWLAANPNDPRAEAVRKKLGGG